MNSAECDFFDTTGYTPLKPVLAELITGAPGQRTLYVISFATIEQALRGLDPFFVTRPCMSCRGSGVTSASVDFALDRDGNLLATGELCECEVGLRAFLKLQSETVSIGWSGS